jgi:hypothetical protein
VNPAKRHQIIQEISKYTRPPALQDDEFTIKQYAEHHGITYSAASSDLAHALNDGLVTRREVKHDGHRRWAYKPVLPDPHPNNVGQVSIPAEQKEKPND